MPDASIFLVEDDALVRTAIARITGSLDHPALDHPTPDHIDSAGETP